MGTGYRCPVVSAGSCPLGEEQDSFELVVSTMMPFLGGQDVTKIWSESAQS